MEFILALFVMLAILAAMAIGVIFGRKPIKGSCGGVGAALGDKDYVCEICGGDESKCENRDSDELPRDAAQTDLGYNAANEQRQ
ncbi:MAG: (Na+)-NQR maturation NqrM [bacterium]